MKYQQAKKLFNCDEIRIKATNEIVKTVNVEVGNKTVFIHANTKDGYKILTHLDVQ